MSLLYPINNISKIDEGEKKLEEGKKYLILSMKLMNWLLVKHIGNKNQLK